MDYTLPSGAILSVCPLDCSEAFAIFQQVFKVIGLLELDLSKIDFKKEFKAQDVLSFQRPITQILSNIELEKSGKKCLTKCTYNSLKINEQTWNNLEARKDYLYALYYALKENCAPFLDGVFSDLKA